MEKHAAFLKQLFASRRNYEAGVHDLFGYCRSVNPAAPWDMLANIDLAIEQERFDSWLRTARPGPVESASIRAYYFGLSEDGSYLRLDGSSEFNGEDDACEWACSVNYRSSDEWTDSDGLAAFAALSERADTDVPILLYLLCLGFTGLLIQKHAPTRLWRETTHRTPVAVGFDDGDAYVVL